VGSLQVAASSEVHGSNPAQPTPVGSPFSMRLLMHVNASGAARLLKEAIQMWEDGTYRVEAGGVRVPDEPGRFVWITDPAMAAGFQGAALRGGVAAGRRLSTVGFDFEGGPDNALDLTGTFGVGQTLRGVIELPSDFPTNPFRHKFHPDHDNLDDRFTTVRGEAYAISRNVEFEFTAEDPTGFTSPDYGHAVIGGSFRETITGLHHRPIRLAGEFRLRRISDSPQLNPTPRGDN
jgi:hypothetical protein